MSETVNTVCGYCGVGCGITLRVEGGKVTGSKGNPDHPANRGRLCTKGAPTVDLLTAGGRQHHAQVRGEGAGARGTVELREAISRTGSRLREIRDLHGPDAIALYVSGQMSLEAQYLATKLAKGYLRTKWLESNSRLCMASAGSGYQASLGADGPPGSYDDLDHADLFLVMGANMADCHPILYLRMMDRVKAGAKLIVVDPRRTATAARADLHLAVRPGTDLALLNGLLSAIADRGALDTEFIAAHTEGWEATAAMLAEYQPARVAEITGLPAADIERAAEMIAAADEWTSLWSMGLNQSTHGTSNTIALCNLHLATGAICRTGSGPFSLTGQPNAMGGREMGYLGAGLPGQRTLADDDDRAYVERVWGLAPGTLRPEAGAGTALMFRQLAAGDIKAAWIICTNPVASMANRTVVQRGLDRAELVIVQDAYADTETASYADVVLPAALWAETPGVMINSERTLTLCAPATPAPGDALPDWQLICLIAAELGYGAAFDYPDAAAVFDELRAFHNPRTGWDLRGVDHDRLAAGPVQWPAAPGGPARNPIRYRDGDGLRFATASGKAQFLPRPHVPPAELPDEAYPMLLTTGRLAHQWHTMTKTGKVAKLNKLSPGPFLQIHPEDAARHGVTDGARVRVSSRRGSALLPVSVDEAVRPGVCFAPMHFADAFGDDIAVNTVTNDAVDPDSLQPEFKVSAVALAPLPAQPVPLTAPENVPGSPLGAALAPFAAGPGELSAEASGFLGGLLSGLSAAPPNGIPTVPVTAPLTPLARAWLAGVLAGVYGTVDRAGDSDRDSDSDRGCDDGGAPRTVTVVWASQTGTAEGYAADAAAALTAAGCAARVRGAEQVTVAELTGTAVFLVATTGDGDAPDNGVALWDALTAAEPGDLDELKFSVLGFGDRAYADFCGFARRLDARLEHLGGARTAPRASCGPDYAPAAARWLASVIEGCGAGAELETSAGAELETSAGAERAVLAATGPPTSPVGHSRTRPRPTRLVSSERLSGPGSAKDVRRFTFALPATELTYRAGDALGVWPRNSPAVIEEFCARTSMRRSPDLDRLDLTRITPDLLRFISERAGDNGAGAARLREVIAEPARFADWARGRQLLDLLAAHPTAAPPDRWRALLRPLTPRLYSISSSPREDPDAVSITVAAVEFECAGARRAGVCSSFLAALRPGHEVDVFVQRTRAFLPPADPATPAVMIGPGTGIAPFRGFLYERAGAGHTGGNWLLFGEQHEATDFYYRGELESLLESGSLTRLDTAFSRDTETKVYVQDRMREHAAQLWRWIRDGAHVYVCGDAARMARDVDETLRGIVAEHGHMAPRSAGAYVAALAAEGRYVRDVY